MHRAAGRADGLATSAYSKCAVFHLFGRSRTVITDSGSCAVLGHEDDGASSSSFDKFAQVRVSSHASNTRAWPVHETTPIRLVSLKPRPTVISSPGRQASCPVSSIRAGVPSRSATLQPGGQATSMSTKRPAPAPVPIRVRTTRQFVEASISRVRSTQPATPR